MKHLLILIVLPLLILGGCGSSGAKHLGKFRLESGAVLESVALHQENPTGVDNAGIYTFLTYPDGSIVPLDVIAGSDSGFGKTIVSGVSYPLGQALRRPDSYSSTISNGSSSSAGGGTATADGGDGGIASSYSEGSEAGADVRVDQSQGQAQGQRQNQDQNQNQRQNNNSPKSRLKTTPGQPVPPSPDPRPKRKKIKPGGSS